MDKIEFIPSVLTPQECARLLEETDPKCNSSDMTYFSNIDTPLKIKKLDVTFHPLVKDILSRLNINEKIVDTVKIVYYPEGSENPLHSDSSALVDDKVVKFKDWVSTGVLFLNDNFDCGELVYPKQGLIVKPTIGCMLIAPTDFNYAHYVAPTMNGERFSLVFRFYENIYTS